MLLKPEHIKNVLISRERNRCADADATFGNQRTPVPKLVVPKIPVVTCFRLNLLLSIVYSDAARCAVGQ
jgi:hypothetical protein